MIFIFGTKDRLKETGSGSFYCPACGVPRHYTRFEMGRYFSLYFLPVFRTKVLGEFVQCDICQRHFPLDVLEHKATSATEQRLTQLRSQLNTGMPLHMLVNQLVAQGVDRASAEQWVEQAAAQETVACPSCGFVYQHGVSLCMNCGTVLPHE